MYMTRLLQSNTQDIIKIRERGYVYVDKTAHIHDLISTLPGACFLSRPRRFGKSLLCSTMAAIFDGKRELFRSIAGQPALAIDSLDWDWEVYPVIYIDLNPGNYSGYGVKELYVVLNFAMETAAKKYGVPFVGETIIDKFMRLIHALHEHCGRRVAVIIDEYDKPLLETIDKPEHHAEIRGALKSFYGVLKYADAHIQFAFITGVTKFAHVSIFSDMNQITDLTLKPRYADICGFTQEELEQNFDPEITEIAKEKGIGREEYLEKLRAYYNGYRFTEKPLTVYNPFGMLNHLQDDGRFEKYWYESGSPSFLIKLITDQKIDILNLNDMSIGLEDLHKYDVEHMKAVPVLYQAGYLTITGYNDERERYTLDYPNIEVRSSFAKTLMEQYLKVPDDRPLALSFRLPDLLEDGDIESAMEVLKTFLAGVPYDIIRDNENYFQTVTFLVFSMFGLNIRAETRIAAGRVDAIVETKKFVYCFEFKFNKTADEALAQIDTKDYLLPWSGGGKKLFKVGVNFDPEVRNISEWKYVVKST